MAILEMSPVLASGITQRIIDATNKSSVVLTNNSSNFLTSLTPLIPYNITATYGQAYIVFHIMQTGSGIPSDLSSLSTITARSSDQLITFGSASTTDGTFVSTCNVSTNPAVINSLYRAATATGTATWFRWLVYNASYSTIYHQAIGTVGLSGSGADLELPSTNIVNGQLYRILNFRIQIPTSWEI